MRFGERLRVDLGAGTCLVPPLLLQPIVENAVTHGIAHVLAGSTIRLAASRTASTLSFIVENPVDRDRPRKTGAGLGLANVRSRLFALYGADARISATEQDGVWRVEIARST